MMFLLKTGSYSTPNFQQKNPHSKPLVHLMITALALQLLHLLYDYRTHLRATAKRLQKLVWSHEDPFSVLSFIQVKYHTKSFII